MAMSRQTINSTPDTAQTEKRPWGNCRLLHRGPGHTIQTITVRPGQGSSLQRHKRREELWFIQQGTARITIDAASRIISTGQYAHIPRGCVHRIENAGSEEVVLMEIQIGDYFGDDDTERFTGIHALINVCSSARRP
jgi:mannose-6-phosphate isomerase-like protein (cupin superfamily)